MMRITDLEKQMIQLIIKDYEKYGVENTEFHNTYGYDAETNKVLRGAFSSLKRKKIISHYNDPGCFNPIYPTQKLVDVCHENGIEISDVAWKAMRGFVKEYEDYMARVAMLNK